MAFCENCGALIADDSNVAFCATCGRPISKEGRPIGSNSKDNFVKNQKAKKKVGLIVIVVLFVAAIIGLVLFALGKRYMTPLNDFMKMINRRNDDIKEVESCSYGKKFGKLDAESWETWFELNSTGKDDLEDLYDEIDDEFGDDWSLSFKEKSMKKLNAKEREDMIETLEDYYESQVDSFKSELEDDDMIANYEDWYDASKNDIKTYLKSEIALYEALEDMKIKQIYKVKGTFIFKVDGDKYESDTVTMYFAKTNGGWIYIGMDDDIEFEDDDNYLVHNLVYFYFLSNGICWEEIEGDY